MAEGEIPRHVLLLHIYSNASRHLGLTKVNTNCDQHLKPSRYFMCLNQSLERLPAKKDEHVGHKHSILQGPITITLKCFINNK